MTQKYASILVALFSLLTLNSCYRGAEEVGDDPFGNYDALWTLIDEHYCYLDYKGIDWDALGAKYRKRLSVGMPPKGLFEVMDSLLLNLRDGHVNLYAAHNVSRYDFWSDYPRNFYEFLLEEERYLGNHYKQASGLQYRVLPDNIGYVRYSSFSAGMGEGNISEVLADLALCDGLILDVRHNSGGNADYAKRLASRFTNERVLVSYIYHKTGPGHSDFSEPYPVYLEPSPNIRWQKPVVVLANRHTYSAANDFVCQMKSLPLVTILGDTTGGGGGLPFTSELPNGWLVRFSASPILDADKHHTEWGIAPDIHLDLDADDVAQGLDTHIEKAREILKNEKIKMQNLHNSQK